MSKRRRGPGPIEVAKDLGTYIGGWIIIFKQAGIFFAPPTQISDLWVGVAVVMIGVPGLSQLYLARFGKGTSTVEQQQQQASLPSRASSSGDP